MYLVIIAWIYVVLMMSVAEATNANGTVLGAIVTFFLYGVGPAALLGYLMGTPARKRAIKKREAEELIAAQVAAPVDQSDPTQLKSQQLELNQQNSDQPDTGSHAPSGVKTVAAAGDSSSIAPVGKIP